MSTEDDYDSIDGIINNGPKQPEPSVPRERTERPSVLDRLRSGETREQTEKNAARRDAEREL